VAELVDALASGASGLTAVKVRVLSWAPFACEWLKSLICRAIDPNTGAQTGVHWITSLRKAWVASRKDPSRYQLKRSAPEGVPERLRARHIFWFAQPNSDPLTVLTTIGEVVSFFLRAADPKVAQARRNFNTAELSSAKTSRPAASCLTRLLPFVATKFVHGCVTNAGDSIMRAQRVWKPVGVDKHKTELERLHLELASLNKRIAELEQSRSQSSTIEALKSSALMLSRQIDDLRSSIATEQLASLLAK
jgi:hypothetical protein